MISFNGSTLTNKRRRGRWKNRLWRNLMACGCTGVTNLFWKWGRWARRWQWKSWLNNRIGKENSRTAFSPCWLSICTVWIIQIMERINGQWALRRNWERQPVFTRDIFLENNFFWRLLQWMARRDRGDRLMLDLILLWFTSHQYDFLTLEKRTCINVCSSTK